MSFLVYLFSPPGLTSEDLCFTSSRSHETVSFFKLPGSSQLIGQWVPVTFSLVTKQPVCEVDHLPPSSAGLSEWCLPLFPHLPSCCATAAAIVYHNLNIS